MEPIVPMPLAKWNPKRDCWEDMGRIDLLSELLDVFSETFPISGMTRNGLVYVHPMLGHHMEGSGYSYLPTRVFSTPDTVPEAPNKGTNSVRTMGLGNQVQELLPTPNAWDGQKGARNPDRPHNSQITLVDWAQAVLEGKRATRESLLPTPVANDSGNTPEDHLRKKPGTEVVTSLTVLIDHNLLPTGGRIVPPSNGGSKS